MGATRLRLRQWLGRCRDRQGKVGTGRHGHREGQEEQLGVRPIMYAAL